MAFLLQCSDLGGFSGNCKNGSTLQKHLLSAWKGSSRVFLTWLASTVSLKMIALLLSRSYLAKENPNKIRDTSGLAQWAGTVLK